MDAAPSYIDVRKSGKTIAADQAFVSLGADQETLVNHAILNGVLFTDTIDAGTALKIVVPGSLGVVW